MLLKSLEFTVIVIPIIQEMGMHIKTNVSVMNIGNNIFQVIQYLLVMLNLIMRKFLSHAIVIEMYSSIITISMNPKMYLSTITTSMNPKIHM